MPADYSPGIRPASKDFRAQLIPLQLIPLKTKLICRQGKTGYSHYLPFFSGSLSAFSFFISKEAIATTLSPGLSLISLTPWVLLP